MDEFKFVIGSRNPSVMLTVSTSLESEAINIASEILDCHPKLWDKTSANTFYIESDIGRIAA